MNIYITRHSKTVWNQEKRLQGHGDSPLTKEGIENALALKEYIMNQNMHFDFIYSSPILRAYQTAQIVFETQSIIKDERLKEMCFGIYEGKKISDILVNDLNHQYDFLWNHPERFERIEKGESYNEVILRVKSFLYDLEKLPDDSNVFIVTHGMYFIVLLATMMGLDKKDYIQLNRKVVEGCSLTCLTYKDEQYQLVYYNKTDYLLHYSDTSFNQ